jgi:hypothetical protein
MNPVTRLCWACEREHTGAVWCPHCSAPVDPGSMEAQRSPYWQADPRLRAVKALTAEMWTTEGPSDG